MSRNRILEPDVRSWFEFIRDEEQREPRINFECVVCPACHGQGTSTAYLGAYTQSDREEMGDEWYEFADDVRAGHYDRTCDTCNGHNVIDQIVESGSDPDDWAHLMGWLRDSAADRAETAMERMMGA